MIVEGIEIAEEIPQVSTKDSQNSVISGIDAVLQEMGPKHLKNSIQIQI